MAEAKGRYFGVYGVTNVVMKTKRGHDNQPRKVACARVCWEPLAYDYHPGDAQIQSYCGVPNQEFTKDTKKTGHYKITSFVCVIDPMKVGYKHAETCFAWIDNMPCKCPPYSKEEWLQLAKVPKPEEMTAYSTKDLGFPIGISKHYYETKLMSRDGRVYEKKILKFVKEWCPTEIPFSHLNRSLQEKLRAGFTFTYECSDLIENTCVELNPITREHTEMTVQEFNRELTSYLQENRLPIDCQLNEQ